MFPEITPDTQKLSADVRRLILPTASLAVFGVNLAVPTARVPDNKLEQLIAQEDQSRRPPFKKAETRQFLVAAQPFLSAPVRYSPAEIVGMMARGERPVAPERPASGDAPAAGPQGARIRGRSGPVSGAAPATGPRPRPESTDVRGHRLRSKTAGAAARAAVWVRTETGASSSGAPLAEEPAPAELGTEHADAADVSGDAPAAEAAARDRSGRPPLSHFSREQVVSRNALAAAAQVLEEAMTDEPMEMASEEPVLHRPAYPVKARPGRPTKRPASRSVGGRHLQSDRVCRPQRQSNGHAPRGLRGHPFPTWRGRRSLRRRRRLHNPHQSNSRTFVSALRQFRPGTALMRRVHRDRPSLARGQPRRPLDLNREEPRGSSFRANGCRLARSAKLLPAHREAPPIRRLRLPLRLPQSSGVDVHNGISMQLSHTRTPT